MKLLPWLALASSGSGRTSTHRAPARVLFVAVAIGALGGAAAGAGCSHEARPVAAPADPSDRPALPPASGTPLGYLFDVPELKLSDDQVARLKVIDEDLATKLMYVDTMQRAASEPPPEEHSRGRMGVGVAAENGLPDRSPTPQAFETTGTGTGAGAGSSAEDKAEARKRVPAVRAQVIRAAISRALAVLDAAQNKLARQLLKDRGIDPDTGKFEATGDPGAARGSDR